MSQDQQPRQILVTGGAGFIGSNLVDSLLAEGGWQVVVLDNFDHFYAPEIKRQNIAAQLKNPSYTLYEADVRDRAQLRDIFARHDFSVIVHLASLAGVRPSLENPAAYMEVNIQGTLNMLDCARDFGVAQFVFGSSSSVYGINATVPFSEEQKTQQPISPYAASKAAAELLCHTYSHLYDLRTICLRFFTVYGARQRPDLAIHKFANLIHQGRNIPLFGDGKSRRDYTFVEDIVQGIRGACDYTGSKFEAINLGGSQTVELVQLVRILESGLKRTATIDWLDDQAGDVPITYADVSKARRLLGYDPKTPIMDGIPKFIDWFLAQAKAHDKETLGCRAE